MLSFVLVNSGKRLLSSVCKDKFLLSSPLIPFVRQSQLCKTISTSIFSKPRLFRDATPLYRNVLRRTTTQVVQPPKKIVGYWLMVCSGMVVVAVLLGGITRLTESGLSMVTWRLFPMERYPVTHEEWMEEFRKYQQFPEYKLLNQYISLEDFKSIFIMEFAHRAWGRLIGAAFYLPAAYFWLKGYLTPALKKRVSIMGVLIATQGLMGWYMVKSGLEDRFHDVSDIPRVSQYRLAAHLGLAFGLYATMLYSTLSILHPVHAVSSIVIKGNILKRFTHLSKGLIFLTVMSGALVAGLDAGLVYNSFPKMGEKWVPDEIFQLSPLPKNFTENPVTVQFDHRILGMTTLAVITTLWLASRRYPLTKSAKRVTDLLALAGLVQVCLGISTLVHCVPTHLAATHQMGSLMLMSLAIWLSHELKFVKYIPK